MLAGTGRLGFSGDSALLTFSSSCLDLTLLHYYVSFPMPQDEKDFERGISPLLGSVPTNLTPMLKMAIGTALGRISASHWKSTVFKIALGNSSPCI